MCGIAGIHRRTGRSVPKINQLADELLLAIESRGRDATGFLAMLDSGKVQTQKDVGPARKFVRRRNTFARDARTVLLHTRFATRGSAKNPRNAHPHVSGSVAAVHNGTIYNHTQVAKILGLTLETDVDSEVIPAIVDALGWDNAERALGTLTGGAATAIVTSDRPDEVLLARLRQYPLVVYVTDKLVVWASTKDAIVRAFKATYGHRPTKGEWIELSEYAALRVNGDLTPTKIRRPAKPKRSALAKNTPKATVKPRGRNSQRTDRREPVVATGSKRARRRHKRAAARPAPIPVGAELEQATVEDLVRWGMTREEAEDEVYGHLLDAERDSQFEITIGGETYTIHEAA